jgi:orotidine-5'-phosphate decarboxylase
VQRPPEPVRAATPATSAARASFGARLHARMRAIGSAVCLGIDPRPADHPLTHPDRVAGDPAGVAKGVVALYRSVLEASHERLACVKPQSAFFEALGIPGVIALAQVIADARSLDVPVILDAKRGDIGSTAEAYARAYLGDGVWSADALTVSPYLGPDTLEPYVSPPRVPRAEGVHARGHLQPRRRHLAGRCAPTAGRLVHEHVADHLQGLAREHGRYGAIGAVVGATRGERLAASASACPTCCSWSRATAPRAAAPPTCPGVRSRRPRRRREREPQPHAGCHRRRETSRPRGRTHAHGSRRWPMPSRRPRPNAERLRRGRASNRALARPSSVAPGRRLHRP